MAFDEGLADRVRQILKRKRGVTERRMFGGVAFLLNGNMCCGVVKTDLMLRLGDSGVRKALEKPHTRRMDFTGKPLKSMLFVDSTGTDSDEALQAWVEAAAAFARTLPPK